MLEVWTFLFTVLSLPLIQHCGLCTLFFLFKSFPRDILSFVIPMFKFVDNEAIQKISETLDTNYLRVSSFISWLNCCYLWHCWNAFNRDRISMFKCIAVVMQNALLTLQLVVKDGLVIFHAEGKLPQVPHCILAKSSVHISLSVCVCGGGGPGGGGGHK